MSEVAAGTVSETAHWIAAHRAMETRRPDAIFKDPHAERLAGPLGANVPKGVPPWPMIMRTKIIDDLILESIRDGVDRVVNLAAGLDTRPYRLALAKDLRWIEIDLPAMIDFKVRALGSETPACALTREAVDLSRAADRAAALDRALEGTRSALVLSEGLLAYLEEPTVRALSDELYSRERIRFWMIDLASPAILKRMQKATDARLGEADRLKFGPASGVAFFEKSGWKARDIQNLYRAALRYDRLPFFMKLFRFFPDPDPRNPGKAPWGAVVRFARS
jgi:methyltransferase (TIGR00027 family)